MFTAPYNRAGFFAELWMLQYVSNVENWAFGELTYEELDVMFGTHVQVRFFGRIVIMAVQCIHARQPTTS